MLSFVNLGWITIILGGWVGGWMGEIEGKVHLSPDEAKFGAELGNKSICFGLR